MATKQQTEEKHVYDTEEEATGFLKTYGSGMRIFPIWLPRRTVYAVAKSGYEALGYLVSELGLFEVPVTGERQETSVRRQLERLQDRHAEIKATKRVKGL